MKQKILALLLAAATAVVFTGTVPSLLSPHSEREEKNQLQAEYVYGRLFNVFTTPIVVSRSMSANPMLKKILREEISAGGKKTEALLSEYLNEVKNSFGYSAVFAVSDETRRYYTCNGIARIINPQNPPYDSWYQLFIDSNAPYALISDRDKVHNYQWTVFVNMRVFDDDGTLLGVCGVGVYMDDLQKLVAHLEKEFDVKISLIDKNGLVQVDTDSSNIESTYIFDAIRDDAGSAHFTYTKRPAGGWRKTRYMKTLGWYLVIQNFAHASGNGNSAVAAILVYALLAALVAVIIMGKAPSSSRASRAASLSEDSLTKLPNRNYLREAYGEFGVFNTTRYKAIAMFDVDRFETVNDMRDGNKILLDIVALAKSTVDGRGLLFRWAGDEFVVFLEMEVEEAETRFIALCSQITELIDVTISVGIVAVDLTESIKTNYHRAVEQCYKAKASGGNKVCVQK